MLWYNQPMDSNVRALWRLFQNEPSLFNYERLAYERLREGVQRTLISAAEPIMRFGQCNLSTPDAEPNGYSDSVLQDTILQIERRLEELRQGSLQSYKSRGEHGRLVEHEGWKGYVEVFKPNSPLPGEGRAGRDPLRRTKMCIVIISDPAGNAIAWHNSLPQAIAGTAAAAASGIFRRCWYAWHHSPHQFSIGQNVTGKMRYIFTKRKTKPQQIAWHDVKTLLIEIMMEHEQGSTFDVQYENNPEHRFQGLTSNNWGRIAERVEQGLHIEGARGTRRKRTIYITPYVQETDYPLKILKGVWRVSMIVGDRPFGHQYFKTKKDAIRSLVKSTSGLLGSSSWVYNASQGRIATYDSGEGDYYKIYTIVHPLKIIEIA